MTAAGGNRMLPAMNDPTALPTTECGARRIRTVAFRWAAPAAL